MFRQNLFFYIRIMERMTRDSQLAMIAQGDERKIMAYINETRFDDDVVVEAALQIPAECVKIYHKRWILPERGFEALIKRGDHELIMWAITEAAPYCNCDFGHELIHRGNHAEIIAYIDCGFNFSYTFGMMLLQRKDQEEVIKYFQKYPMDMNFARDMAQQGLLRIEDGHVFFDVD